MRSFQSQPDLRGAQGPPTEGLPPSHQTVHILFLANQARMQEMKWGVVKK